MRDGSYFRNSEDQEAHLEHLDEVLKRQVEDGTLAVRQMTPQEREFWGPPKNLTPGPRKGRRPAQRPGGEPS